MTITLILYYLARRQFTKLSSRYCKRPLGLLGTFGYFDSRYDAEFACDQMHSTYGNCTTIFDVDCNDDLYRLCVGDVEVGIRFQERSCVYHTGA